MILCSFSRYFLFCLSISLNYCLANCYPMGPNSLIMHNTDDADLLFANQAVLIKKNNFFFDFILSY